MIATRTSLAWAAALAASLAATVAAEPNPRAPAGPPRAPAPPPPAIERSRLVIEPAGRPFKQISIENPLGDVRIEGHDGSSIEIESHKIAPNDEALDRLRISLVPNPDGTVRIKTTADGNRESRSIPRDAMRIDLIVRAPRDARVEAAASSGELTVSNMDAGGDLDTASGTISVRNVQGELSTHSVTGRTSLVQVFGSIDAQTISSDLDLDSINGERLVASASHGRIAGRRVRSRDVELTTTDGMIMLEAEAALRGHLIIASVSGDLDVRIRHRGVLVVRARGGKIDLGGQPHSQKTRPDGWVEAQYGQFSGGATSSLIEMRSQRGTMKLGILQ